MSRWFYRSLLGLGLTSLGVLCGLTGLVWFRLGGPGPVLQICSLFLLALLVWVGFAAWTLVCEALFSSRVSRCRQRLDEFPLRCYLSGWLLLLTQIWLSTLWPPLVLLWLVVNPLLWCLSLPALAGMAAQGLGLEGRWASALGSLPLGLTLAFPGPGWLLLSQLLIAALGAACP